jgi:hypothetical protein
MKQDDEIQLLKDLTGILERQIELVRHDDIAGVDGLIGCGEQLALKITAAGLLDRPQYEEWRDRLTGLYRELQLMLSTQKEAVAGQLRSINKGQKTLAVYRDGI